MSRNGVNTHNLSRGESWTDRVTFPAPWGFESPLPCQYHEIHMEKRFKVVKIGRKSMRRTVLRRNLTEAEARQVVNRYPDSTRSMVVYMAE